MVTATKAVYQYLIDNPGWHFTEDIVDGVLALHPELKRHTLSITPYNLIKSRKMLIEDAGSGITKKWRAVR